MYYFSTSNQLSLKNLTVKTIIALITQQKVQTIS